MFGGNIVLVTTRDVLSFASVYPPDSFPAESTCVSLWSAQCELCGCCCSALRVLYESQLILCTRLCVPNSRHDMHTTQVNLMCPSYPVWWPKIPRET